MNWLVGLVTDPDRMGHLPQLTFGNFEQSDMLTQRGKSFGQSGAAIAIYFFSGIAALILQISWSRQIGLLLGQTIHAATTVLAAYFIGMAIGYLVGAGRRFSRRPLAA